MNPLKVVHKQKTTSNEDARVLWETVLKPKWQARDKANLEKKLNKSKSK